MHAGARLLVHITTGRGPAKIFRELEVRDSFRLQEVIDGQRALQRLSNTLQIWAISARQLQTDSLLQSVCAHTVTMECQAPRIHNVPKMVW